jgi:hypothetical protein
VLLARLRLLLARRPWIYWTVATAVAALAAWAVHAAIDAAHREQHRWGTARTVWITDRPVDRGDRISASARTVPIAVVPDDAVDEAPSQFAAHPLGGGQIVVTGDLARSPPPDDSIVIAIAIGSAPVVLPGDRVTLIGGGAVLCTGTVDHVTDQTVDVAVTTACAVAATAPLLEGDIVMARGP